MGEEGVRRIVEWMRDIKRRHDGQPVEDVGQGQADVTGGEEEAEAEEGQSRCLDGEGVVAMKEVRAEEMCFLDFL